MIIIVILLFSAFLIHEHLYRRKPDTKPYRICPVSHRAVFEPYNKTCTIIASYCITIARCVFDTIITTIYKTSRALLYNFIYIYIYIYIYQLLVVRLCHCTYVCHYYQFLDMHILQNIFNINYCSLLWYENHAHIIYSWEWQYPMTLPSRGPKLHKLWLGFT